ncbi:hypothetical protein TRVL_10102 [Trypanosoma vivax]|nr:hypothetical protein TRVL_10102 [Trypanosoma vivax]
MFPLPPKLCLFCKTHGMQWRYGHGQLAKWASWRSLNRLNGGVYNRRGLLHAAGARPGMQVESLGGVLKGPRKEEDTYHQACLKPRKQQAPGPSKARCFHCGRMGHYTSTCYVRMSYGPYLKPKSAQRPRKQ